MLPLPDTVAPCPYSVFVNTCGAHIMLGILILLYMCSLFQPLYTFKQTPLRVTYSGQTRRSSKGILTNESTIRLTHIAQLQGAYFLTHWMQLWVYRFIFPLEYQEQWSNDPLLVLFTNKIYWPVCLPGRSFQVFFMDTIVTNEHCQFTKLVTLDEAHALCLAR